MTTPDTGGKLYLVATPIGNLGDITYRAVEVLRAADVIYAEDTRRARILLEKYQVRRRPLNYRDHNAARVAPLIAEAVRSGRRVALVTDAGTPGISDPGYRAVKAVIDAGLPLEVIPGPTAVTTALVLSGLAVDRFVFEGFLPVKKGRQSRLTELSTEARTMVIFEGPHRLLDTLRDLALFLGSDRPGAVARELTKLHEEVRRGTLGGLFMYFTARPPKGEIVIVVAGKARGG